MGDGVVTGDEGTATPQAAWSGGLGMVRLDERRVERVSWLWEGRVPLGKVALVVGDPDVGKSFVLLDLAARVSRGEGVPPETGPGRPRGVLLLCADDDVDDTVLPRLVACGADLCRVVWVSSLVEEPATPQAAGGPGVRRGSAPDTRRPLTADRLPQSGGEGGMIEEWTATPQAAGERRMVSLGRDVGRLEAAARAMGDCGLIVIDPVSAYLGGTDSNSNVEVRRVLWRLGEMARSLGTAVVLVSHHRKAGAASVLHRAIGSLAFTAASRVVLAVVEDPAVGGRKLLLPVKMNLLPASSGRAFRIEEGRVAWEPEAVPL
ncbi:MAG TPA: AAA family ATPase, partial [Planctomycetaceae bacterium]|nr:AAA family ATPase [Planctomycetaceae bacterium]